MEIKQARRNTIRVRNQDLLGAKRTVNAARRSLRAFCMEEEEDASPVPFLNRQEARKWNRLSAQKQEQYFRKGAQQSGQRVSGSEAFAGEEADGFFPEPEVLPFAAAEALESGMDSGAEPGAAGTGFPGGRGRGRRVREVRSGSEEERSFGRSAGGLARRGTGASGRTGGSRREQSPAWMSGTGSGASRAGRGRRMDPRAAVGASLARGRAFGQPGGAVGTVEASRNSSGGSGWNASSGSGVRPGQEPGTSGAFQGTAVRENGAVSGRDVSGTPSGTAAAGVSGGHPGASPMVSAVKAGKKTAEVFQAAIQSRAMEEERMQKELETVQDAPAQFFRKTAAAGASVLTAVVMGLMQAVQSFFLSLTNLFVVVAVGLLCLVLLVVGTISVWISGADTSNPTPAGGGLPPFITEEMMEGFFLTQEQHGIPVSSGIAQVISESGFGLYGPGGEEGQGMSQLAWDYKNLFGIKYASSDGFASGAVNMATGEQTSTGESYGTNSDFSIYPDFKACIQERARKLSLEPYYSHTLAVYPNRNDGNYTREDANGFIHGIREAGWATDIRYVETCISHMERYNLYQYDNMTWEQYRSGHSGGDISYDGTVTPMMERIVEIAKNDAGVYPCVPNMCAAWVTGVYQAAGAPVIPNGDAIDMWNLYSGTGSVGTENIPPGAVVCGSGSGPMGALYGHVGIYIGNGLVAHNAGFLSIQTIEEWSAWQTANCQGHVGWIGWVYPGGIPAS